MKKAATTFIMILISIIIAGNVFAEVIFEDYFNGTKGDWIKWLSAPAEYTISQDDELIIAGVRADYGRDIWGHNANLFSRPIFYGDASFEVDMKKVSASGTGYAIRLQIGNGTNYFAVTKAYDPNGGLNSNARITTGSTFNILYVHPDNVTDDYDNYRIVTTGNTIEVFLNNNSIYSTTLDWINSKKQLTLLVATRAKGDSIDARFDNLFVISEKVPFPLFL